MKACKNCKTIVKGDVCPACNIPTTQYWSNYFGLINPEKSEIANRIDIKVPGQYALKVR